jgi:hypothetical protein
VLYNWTAGKTADRGGLLWQLDKRYRAPHDASHPLVGAFVPDATVATAAGAMAILPLLRAGRSLAIETTPTFDACVERLNAIRVVGSKIDGAGDAHALLVRPDGYVAWAGAAVVDEREYGALAKAIEA